MITPSALKGITAPVAAELANISYRQLDHWARKGWLTPSVEQGTGRPGRRLYGPDDVIKLAALGHFGRSGLDVAQLGPGLATLHLSQGDYLLVHKEGIAVQQIASSDLRTTVAQPGRCCVFDPAALRAKLPGTKPGVSTHRRSA